MGWAVLGMFMIAFGLVGVYTCVMWAVKAIQKGWLVYRRDDVVTLICIIASVPFIIYIGEYFMGG